MAIVVLTGKNKAAGQWESMLREESGVGQKVVERN